MFSIFILIFIHIQSTYVYAISSAAVPFLLYSPSPQANGMGETYGNISSTDPMASIINPAYLGFYSQKHNFGFSFSKGYFLNQMLSDLSYNCYSLNLGYSLKKLPISFGVGYHRVLFDYGEQIMTDEIGPEPIGTFKSWDQSNMVSFSFLLDYYIRSSFGFSYKSIESNLAPKAKGSANAHDFGISFQLPILGIISKITDNSLCVLPDIKPYFDSGFSYSINNIGNEISYVDHTDPLPRSVYTGININSGLKLFRNMNEYNLISFKWAREASDILLDKYIDNEGKYQTRYLSGFNDIHFMDNIILGKRNSNISIHKGWGLGFGDVIFIGKGNYKDINFDEIYDTYCFGINLVQPIRILLDLSNNNNQNEFMKKCIKNIDIEYQHSENNCRTGSNIFEMNFNGVSIKLKTIF